MEWANSYNFNDSGAIDKTDILVVDDDGDTRRMLAIWLATKEFRATCAASGNEALALLRSRPFSLMLTDYNMPGMDGLKLSEEALKASPELIIIMITGASLTQLHRRAAEMGITAVMAKPINFKELFSRINLKDKRRITQLGPTAPLP
jgi:DNA-binding response OmpR family regulator